MSVHMLQVYVHINRLSAIYCNKVIGLIAYYEGCASYL